MKKYLYDVRFTTIISPLRAESAPFIHLKKGMRIKKGIVNK